MGEGTRAPVEEGAAPARRRGGARQQPDRVVAVAARAPLVAAREDLALELHVGERPEAAEDAGQVRLARGEELGIERHRLPPPWSAAIQ